MDLLWVMAGFFLFIVIVFIVIAFAFPEWVGITGKKSREIQRHQGGDEPTAPTIESNTMENK